MTNELDFDSLEHVETIQASFDHLMRENPMGERSKDALRPDFDQKLKLEYHVIAVNKSGEGSPRNTVMAVL